MSTRDTSGDRLASRLARIESGIASERLRQVYPRRPTPFTDTPLDPFDFFTQCPPEWSDWWVGWELPNLESTLGPGGPYVMTKTTGTFTAYHIVDGQLVGTTDYGYTARYTVVFWIPWVTFPACKGITMAARVNATSEYYSILDQAEAFVASGVEAAGGGGVKAQFTYRCEIGASLPDIYLNTTVMCTKYGGNVTWRNYSSNGWVPLNKGISNFEYEDAFGSPGSVDPLYSGLAVVSFAESTVARLDVDLYVAEAGFDSTPGGGTYLPVLGVSPEQMFQRIGFFGGVWTPEEIEAVGF